MSKVDYAEFQKMQAEKRQRLLNKTKQANRPSGGGGNKSGGYEVPAWKKRQEYFKPGTEPTKIRLIPNDKGELWYPYMSKWVSTAKGKRNIISNAWNGDRDMPCVLYYYAVENENADYLASEQMVTTVLVLEDYYKIPKTSAKGNEYHVYEKSLGTDKHGRTLDPAEYQSYEKSFGRKLHWSMWPSQQRNFMNTLLSLVDKCANCKDGEISVYAYGCPQCGGTIADHREEPIDRESEQVLRTQSVVCPHCEATVVAEQQYECVKQDGYGGDWVEGCGSPIRISLDEPLDLVIRAVPAGRSVAIEVLEFGPASDDGKSIPDWMTKPFEFDSFFGKMDLADQANSMGLPMPFEESAQALVDQFFEAQADEEDDDSIPF